MTPVAADGGTGRQPAPVVRRLVTATNGILIEFSERPPRPLASAGSVGQ
jgi:hypothetical protein